MTEEEIENAKKKVRLTLTAQHKDKTKKNYDQYLPPMHDWYVENRPQVCNERGIDLEKFHAAVATHDGIKEETLWFHLFLEKRSHTSLIDPETIKPKRALVGTLGGCRSAFTYFV